MSSSKDKTVAEDRAANALTVRVRVGKSVTRKIGEDYQKVEIAVEGDLPSGITVPDYIIDLAEPVDAYLSSQKLESGSAGSVSQSAVASSPKPSSTSSPIQYREPPTQTSSTPSSTTSHPVSRTLQKAPQLSIDPLSLDRLPWTPFNSGNGSWIKSDLPAAGDLKTLLEKDSKASADIAGYHYKLSGQDRQFVNRFKARSSA